MLSSSAPNSLSSVPRLDFHREIRRTPYEKRLEYASLMIELGARATTIASSLQLPRETARKLYKKVTKGSSPSGMNPTDHKFYFTPSRRIHSSLFLSFYLHALSNHSEIEAMIIAYQHYSLCTDSPLTYDRAWYLTRYLSQKWNLISRLKCKSCHSVYIVEQIEAVRSKFQCPVCSGRMDAAQKLKQSYKDKQLSLN